MPRRLRISALPLLLTLALAACGGGNDNEVVIYTSVDQNFSEPVLNAFESETGITVRAVYDVEAAKTTGLVNRLLEERERPVADVWWNGEFAQTIELAEQAVLQPYQSPEAETIPSQYIDANNLWTGFGGRARVIIVNTDRMPENEWPDNLGDISNPVVDADQVGMALPLFGTTATHAAALYAAWGPEDGRAYFQEIADSGVQIPDGNSVVRDQVADGRLVYGMTDTDDACGALERGAPVAVVFPNQEPDDIGTLIVPNTVGLVAGAPNQANGQRLIDYLLSESTARRLVDDGWFQVLVRPIETPDACIDASGVKGMDVNLADIADQIETALADMSEIFVQ